MFSRGARLAQSVEHETLNLRVVGSSPTLGEYSISILLSATFRHLPLISKTKCLTVVKREVLESIELWNP